MIERRRVRLFRIGGNQAVRLPMEYELPCDEAIIYREGTRLVVEPVHKRRLTAVLKSMTPLDEPFPEIDDPAPSSEAR
jgi:antitoxin VapB